MTEVPKMIWREHAGYIFNDAATKHKVLIGEGDVLMMIPAKGKPELLPLYEPGNYEVDLEWVAKDVKFPIILMILPRWEAEILVDPESATPEQIARLKAAGAIRQ